MTLGSCKDTLQNHERLINKDGGIAEGRAASAAPPSLMCAGSPPVQLHPTRASSSFYFFFLLSIITRAYVSQLMLSSLLN